MLTMTDNELDLWMAKLDDFEVTEGDTEINGLQVSVSQDTSFHSNKVVQYLTLPDYAIQLKRDGYKELSYDSWVDTNWYSWEKC